MQDPKSKILQYRRLITPQKRGKLANFTKDFEDYAEHIDQVVKGKVQFSFELNKFGLQKGRFSDTKPKTYEQSKDIEHLMNSSNISIPSHYGCNKYLRYNEPGSSPKRKLKMRNNSEKKMTKQLSQPSFINIKAETNQQLPNIGYKLPKITLTSRERSQDLSLLSKNSLSDSKTVRIQNHQILGTRRNQHFIRLYHIVTMGRKQIINE